MIHPPTLRYFEWKKVTCHGDSISPEPKGPTRPCPCRADASNTRLALCNLTIELGHGGHGQFFFIKIPSGKQTWQFGNSEIPRILAWSWEISSMGDFPLLCWHWTIPALGLKKSRYAAFKLERFSTQLSKTVSKTVSKHDACRIM